jgi:hypothetical protein
VLLFSCYLPCHMGDTNTNTHGDWYLGEVQALRSKRPVSSRVGESKILRYSERAYPLGCISARSRLGPPTTYKDTHGLDVPKVHLLPKQDPPQECGIFALSALWTGWVGSSGSQQLVRAWQGQRDKGKRYLHCRTLSRLSPRTRSRKTLVQR